MFIKGASHCQDMGSPNKYDSQFLTDGRKVTDMVQLQVSQNQIIEYFKGTSQCEDIEYLKDGRQLDKTL